MRSWRIARIAGIDVNVHWSFIILPMLVGFSALSNDRGLAAAAYSVAFVLAIFGCVLLHELGHALMARRFGIQTSSITLLPIGGVASLDRMPERPLQELAVALAGPAVNVVIAALLVIPIWVGSAGQMPSAVAISNSFLGQLMLTNIALVIFNLLPAFPMDGGRVLRAILATRLSYVRATDIATRVGQVMAVLFAIVGFYGQWMLVFIAMFVYVAGRAEAQMARAKASLQGWSVRDAMQRDFQMIPADATVQQVAQAVALSPQPAFPVVDGHSLVGILEKPQLLMAANHSSQPLVVRDIVRHDLPALEPDAPLTECLEIMQQKQVSSLPVMRSNQLVGLITAANLQRWMAALNPA